MSYNYNLLKTEYWTTRHQLSESGIDIDKTEDSKKKIRTEPDQRNKLFARPYWGRFSTACLPAA